jgi:hypothetical protein
VGLIEALVPCLTVIARVPQTQAGKAEEIGASFLGAPASGWFGPVTLVGSFGGLADGGASGWPVIGWGASHFRSCPDVGANGFNRPVLKHGPRSLTCVRVLRVAKTRFKMRSESKRRWDHFSLKKKVCTIDRSGLFI